MNQTALLIDGNALIHRAWHALPPLTAPDGSIINAVYGFTTVLQKILQTERPDYLVVCWDTPEPTYRHTAEPAYKAQREEQPQEFYDQFPKAEQIVRVFGGHNISIAGYEADDLLATAATQLAGEHVDVTVLTSDRDAWQMIRPGIRVLSFKKGVSDTIVYDSTSFFAQTGLHPSQVPDWKALAGDSSDNLKGVPGIGDKTALELLQAFGDLDGILAAARDASSPMKPGVRAKLLAGETAAHETLKLVRLMTHAPIAPVAMLRRSRVDETVLRETLLGFGFKTLAARLAPSAPKAPSTKPAASSPLSNSVSSEATASTIVESDVDEVLRQIETDGVMYLHAVHVAQASLFQDVPVLLIGSATTQAVVTRTQVEDARRGERLAALISRETIQKIGHDVKRVWHWCAERGMILRGISFDTEIAAYVLAAGERSYELSALALARLGVTLADDAVDVQVVDVLRALHRRLADELTAEKLAPVVQTFELPLIPILGEMECEGILIDRPYFTSLHETFLSEKQRLESEMVALAGESFNPASPSQLAHVLFDVLQLSTKGIKRGKTGLSTAASELEKLEGAHPMIEKVGEYREVAKLLSTYVDALPLLADAQGRIHTTFHQTIAATGRLSSTEPNLQNIPIRTELGRSIRRGFVAKPGYQLVSCDYSQIELRVIAALAKDPAMLRAFEQGKDIHTASAAAMWNVSESDVTKDQRRAAKAINFGIIYGQGPQGLAKAAGVSFDEAKKFIADYFAVYAGIRAYLDQTKAIVHAQGFVETLFGRRRPVPDIHSPLPQLRAAAERMAINMPVQGTAADIMKLGMQAVAASLSSVSSASRLLLQVHDELVLEVPDADVARVAAFVTDRMATCVQIGVPIVVEAKVGSNWEEMHPVR